MNNMDLDTDGYPTKEALRDVRLWPPNDLDGLMVWLKGIWWHPELIRREGNAWLVSTGGWSGNEALVQAMTENTEWWCAFWQELRHGGHYRFSAKGGE